MSSFLTASPSTYLPYSHLRSGKSPGRPPVHDMQHHPIVTPVPPQWNPVYAKYGYPYAISPSECADCNTECREPTCSTSDELTSQCTDQCVVITCSDPEHDSLNCADSHSSCDFVCDSATDCTDCNGFDAFVSSLPLTTASQTIDPPQLQCCEEYHPCYADQTRPANFSQSLQQPQDGGHHSWDASLAAAFCGCGQTTGSNKLYPSTHTTPPAAATPILRSTPDNNTSRCSPMLASYNVSPSTHVYPALPPPLPSTLQDSQLVQHIPQPQTQPHQPHPSSSSPSAHLLTCMWGDCRAQFASLSELVGHVNLAHLRRAATPESSDSRVYSSSIQPHKQCVDDTIRLPCQWGDCTEYLQPQLLSGASNGNAVDVMLSSLASHLFQDHLGLHDLRCNNAEANRILAGVTTSQPQEQGRQNQEPQQSQCAQSGSGSTSVSVAAHPVSSQKFQGENGDLEAYHQDFNALTTPSPRTTTTAISSPTTSVGEVPLTPGEGHVCRWQACGVVFETCDDLMTHMSAVHVGSGKPQYDCLWEGCTRNGDKGFSSKQKISRHLQVCFFYLDFYE